MQFLKSENGLKFLHSFDRAERVESRVGTWAFREERKADINLAPKEQPSFARRNVHNRDLPNSRPTTIDYCLPSDANARLNDVRTSLNSKLKRYKSTE